MANDWQRFRWNLKNDLGTSYPDVSPFVFRTALPDEGEAVMQVVASALMMERAWTGGKGEFARDLERHCLAAFELEPPACVVVQHGGRIIGASVLCLEPGADLNIVSGPCVLHEYRSRGLGTALLHRSLERLKSEGLPEATALGRTNSTVARFLYGKFGGTPEEYSFSESPKLAA